MEARLQTVPEVEAVFQTLQLRDRRRLFKRFQTFCAAYRGEKGIPPDQESAVSFLRDLEKMASRSLIPYADSLKYSFPEELPITAKIPEIRELLQKNQVVIVCGATGSGKTTQLPKAALAQGFGRSGRIGCTQPRRIAAAALAQRLAQETNCNCGQQVGYQVRFDDHTAESTVIKFMTDGILLAETRNDPDLTQYDCLILDEVHERSLNIDFLLGYMKLLLTRRKDLRVIVSSATLESGRISEFFGNAPIVEVEGRLFPIEDCYLEPDEEEDLPETIARGVEFLNDLDPAGDILVFLPGEREIRDANEMLTGRHYSRTEILPLFGRLSAGEQERIFKPGALRRIILATNVAETSLTIPRIRFVIDSGLVRLSRYNPRNRIQELRVESVSQASARQRRGRCGRLRDGICVHLYTEESLTESVPYTDPEILRSSLAGVILQMAALRLPRIDRFPFVDAPTPAHIREGLQTLEDLGAITPDQRLTRLGWQLAEFPLDPHLARILLAAESYRMVPELLVIVAFLTIADPRERPFDQAGAADAAHRHFDSEQSDFLGILKLWTALEQELAGHRSQQALRKFAKKNFLNYKRIREWRNLVSDLAELMELKPAAKTFEFDPETVNYPAVHKSLMSGLPRQLAAFRPEERTYMDRTGKQFLIFPGSGLAKRKNPPKWLLSFTLVETSRVFARSVAEVEPLWLEEVAPQLCKKTYDAVMWDPKSGFVTAREKILAGQLVIHPGRRCHYGKIDPVESRKIFIRDALVTGALNLAGSWLERFSRTISSIHALELKLRRPESLLDETALEDHFLRVIPPQINSLDSLRRDWNQKHCDYSPKMSEILLDDFSEDLFARFPDFLEAHGQKYRLEYEFEPGEASDGITLFVPEHCLNLFSPYVLDYLVPGYLEWKVDYLLRSLPKAARKEIMPLSDCVDSFMTDDRNGRIFRDQPLTDTLADYLNECYSLEIEPEIWSGTDLPEYLRMKLAILGENGKVIRRVTEFPASVREDSRLSPMLDVSKKWDLSNCTDFPGVKPLPLSVEISPQNHKKAYPALVEESVKTVGQSLFLNEDEAKRNHERAIFRLYFLQCSQMVRYQLQSAMKVPNHILLSFFRNDPDWREDLLKNAIVEAFGKPLWQIRSSAEFHELLDRSRDTLSGIVQEHLEQLNRIYEPFDRAERLLKRIDRDSLTYQDVTEQLDFLFRPGFLLCPEAVGEYSRYLRSLAVRLERAVASPLTKDEMKGEGIEPYIRKFLMAAGEVRDLTTQPELVEFFQLLEEARISAFTPEIKTLVKCSPAVLQKKWEELRIR